MRYSLLILLILFAGFLLTLNVEGKEVLEGYLMIKTGPTLEYFLNRNGEVIKLEGNVKPNLANEKVTVTGFRKAGNFYVETIKSYDLNTNNLPYFITPVSHPPKGVQNTYVILIEFSDVRFNSLPDILTSTINKLNRMNEFYLEASYNTTYFNYTIHPSVINMNKTLSYYGSDCGQIDCRFLNLVSDVLIASKVNLDEYYRIIIIHAGNDQAISGNPDDIWSASSLGEWSVLMYNKIYKVSISVVSHRDPMGVFAHEVAHQLGLPDLYLAATQESLLGYWDLMDIGALNGDPRGSSPAHMNSLLKYYLGWIGDDEIVIIRSNTLKSVQVSTHEIKSSSVKLIKIEITSTKYFVIEARKRIGFDYYLPSEGVLIMYVDNLKASGEGPITLVNPSKKFADATFVEGEFYSNDGAKLLISVLSSGNNTYEVGVNYQLWLELKSITAENSRVSLGEKVRIQLNLTWYNNTSANNIEIELISGEKGRSNTEGIAIIEVSRNKVGASNFTVKSASYQGIPVYIVSNKQIKIIWDAIELYHTSYDGRVDVNTTVNIQLKLRYSYDKTEFTGDKGYLEINGTPAKYENGYWVFSFVSNKVGKLKFTITKIEDKLYNISALLYLTSEPEIIWDRISAVPTINETRTNVNGNARIYFKLISEYDDSNLKEGEVEVLIKVYEGDQASMLYKRANYSEEKNSWYIDLSYPRLVKIELYLHKLNWFTHGITAFNDEHSYLGTIIFDKINVVEYFSDYKRLEIGKPAKLYARLVYAYDGKQLEEEAKVYINGKLAKGLGNGIFYIETTKNEVDILFFKVTSASSAKYNVTDAEENVFGYVIFDKILYKVDIRNGLFTYTITIQAYYSYDNKIVENAILIINDKKENLDRFEYEESFQYFGIFYEINIEIIKEGFSKITFTKSSYNIGNLIFYILLITTTTILILYLILKKIKPEYNSYTTVFRKINKGNFKEKFNQGISRMSDNLLEAFRLL